MLPTSFVLFCFYFLTVDATDYCKRECTKFKQVCGSDGKVYDSHCHMKKTNCLNKGNVTVRYHGTCECPTVCPKEYVPHCGSNGKTYLNFCQFKKETCKSKDKKIIIKKKGPCKVWVKKNCPEGCVDIWAPVCASNGKTYSSICAVKLDRCKSRDRIGLKKVGYCKKGLCPESCPENYRPVCGNDGILYVNECELRLKACKTKKMKELKRSSKKICRNKCISSCPKIDRKVCGSDSITYSNLCELYRQTCLKKKVVTLVKKQPCDSLERSLPSLRQKIAVDIGSAPVSKR